MHSTQKPVSGISYSNYNTNSNSTGSPLPGVYICFIFIFSFVVQENNTVHIITILLEILSPFLNFFFRALKKTNPEVNNQNHLPIQWEDSLFFRNYEITDKLLYVIFFAKGRKLHSINNHGLDWWFKRF